MLTPQQSYLLRHVKKHVYIEDMQIKIPRHHAPTTPTEINQYPNV